MRSFVMLGSTVAQRNLQINKKAGQRLGYNKCGNMSARYVKLDKISHCQTGLLFFTKWIALQVNML